MYPTPPRQPNRKHPIAITKNSFIVNFTKVAHMTEFLLSRFDCLPVLIKGLFFIGVISLVIVFLSCFIFKPQKTNGSSLQTSTEVSKSESRITTTKNRPTFIKATNVKGLTLENNTAVGDVDFADLENVTDLKASGNKHITPDNK